MVEIADIKDEESLREWLEGRSREEAIWIATRAAMRVLPLYWEWTISRNAWEGGLTVLPVLRSLLASSVVAVRPSEENKARVLAAQQVEETAFTSDGAARQPVTFAFFAVLAAVNVAASAQVAAATEAAIAAKYTAGAKVDSDAGFAGAAAWNATQADCGHIVVADMKTPPQLWPQTENASEPEWSLVKATATEPEWAFWIAWYQDALDGVPPDWDLLERIALIDNAIWDAGPKAVDAEIAMIEKQVGLLRDVRIIKESTEETKAAVASIAHRSHNQPPELLEAESALFPKITIFWEALDQAEAELEKPKPEPKKLLIVAKVLWGAITSVAKYCASLGDQYLTEAAKEAGAATAKWGVPTLIGLLAAHYEPVRSLAGGMKELAELLLKGALN